MLFGFIFITFLIACESRIHHLTVQREVRHYIELTDFGFLKKGSLLVQVHNFTVQDGSGTLKPPNGEIGFTLSLGDEVDQHLKSSPQGCALKHNFKPEVPVVKLVFEKNKLVISRHGTALKDLLICDQTFSMTDWQSHCLNVTNGSDEMPLNASTSVRPSTDSSLLNWVKVDGSHDLGLNTQFYVHFLHDAEEGAYSLDLHNCFNYGVEYRQRYELSFTINMTERNEESYLQAGDILRPNIYFGTSCIYFVTALIWVAILRISEKQNVFKIHYVMAALVFLKSMSLFFHGVDYYFIEKYGKPQEIWAIIYYVMHLLKGALLFGTVILIGTGWTFFKHFLTERDKKIFMVVIPLQVLDNIALIIVEETEHGDQHYKFWFQLLIFVDLLCCAAVILPAVWSIRHLTEASETDGKAAFSLVKLRQFRHFYVIIICYIYLTRILKYLVAFAVPFRYTWLVVIVEEIGTWGFFVVTGYKFKPRSNNPYLMLAQSDDEDDEALTQSGALEGVVRIKKPNLSSRLKKVTTGEGQDSDERQLVRASNAIHSDEDVSPVDKESSHVYD